MSISRVSIQDRRLLLGHRHRLIPAKRTDDVVAITRSLVALHSSDPVTVYLSVIARMENPSFAPIATAIYEDQTLVRHHAMRRTLWVFDHDGLRICHAGATRRVGVTDRKRTLKLLSDRTEIADVEGWLADASKQVIAFLSSTTKASTREIGDALPHLKVPMEMAPGKPYNAAGSALSRVLLQLGFEGEIVRAEPTGGWNTSQYQWTLMSRAIDVDLAELDANAAQAELAHRWLCAFGPAPASDLQWWAGWPAGVTKKALERTEAIKVMVESAPGNWVEGWSARTPQEPVQDNRWVSFLPGLDPTTMGWKNRDWYLDPAFTQQLFDRNGNGGSVIWVDGEIVGGWVQSPDGTIKYELLAKVAADRKSEIASAARGLEEVIGDRRFKLRFPAPIQRKLLS